MSDFFVLPEALMMDIWLGLSIKSSVRFRCVSKSWCDFLSDPHFIYKNLTLSEVAAADELLLLVNMERPHYSLVSRATLKATPLQVPPEVPIPDPAFNPNVLTPPCDDMVCFYDSYDDSIISVWNLTTGETKRVPRLISDSEDVSRLSLLTLGFGFDEKTKEYKIVQILHYMVRKMKAKCVAYVYSLSSSSNNGWRKVGEPKMPLSDDGDGDPCPYSIFSCSYRDGKSYWGCSDLIVCFDMSTEVFNTISIPFIDAPKTGIENICKLKEGSMLMTFCSMIGQYWERLEYEMWALLELGVTQSWTKLLVVDWGREEGGEPFGFWGDEVILKSESNGGAIISDPFKREVKEIQLDEPVDISSCVVWRKGKKATTTSLLRGT